MSNNISILKFSAYDGETQESPFPKNYYPLVSNSYITLCRDNSYHGWDEVFELLSVVLARYGVSIVDVTEKDSGPSGRSFEIAKNLSYTHFSYIIGGGILHICGQDWSLALAQRNNDNSVFVNTLPKSEVYRENEYQNGLPAECFAEDVFKAVSSKLGIKQEMSIETLLIGDSYGTPSLEIIPDFENVDVRVLLNYELVNIRCDLHCNWNFVHRISSMGIPLFVTAKSAPPVGIAQFLKNVKKINLYVDENTSAEEVSVIESAGIPYSLLSLSDDGSKEKFNLFDFKPIIMVKNWFDENAKTISSLPSNTSLKSRRNLVSSTGTYMSVFHWREGIPISDPRGSMLLDGADDIDFQRESDFFYYYKLNKKENP